MEKLAVDVVLLPAEPMMELAIEMNRKLIHRYPAKIILDRHSCLPHISLAMGTVQQTDLEAVNVVLADVARCYHFDRLEAVGVSIGTNAVGEPVSAFELDKTPQLQGLHEELMNRLEQFLSYDATDQMIAADGPVDSSTLLWINSYRDKSSFEKFFPHITIGYGRLAEQVGAVAFEARRLALCHLGNHCTCRRILFETPLAGQ